MPTKDKKQYKYVPEYPGFVSGGSEFVSTVHVAYGL